MSISLSSSLYSAFKSLTASSSSYSSDTLSGSVPFTNNSVTILSLGAFSLAKDGGLEPFWSSTSTTESGFVKSSVSVSFSVSVPFTNNSVTIMSLGAFSLAKDGGLEPFWTSTSTTESGFVKSSVSVSSDRYSIVLVNNLCGT